ncbi:MAG: hypothetical protein FWC96_07915 [Oscillospiraceae bacterium]|nr:hypothetical protein [Oscillospiraceae bacterium]
MFGTYEKFNLVRAEYARAGSTQYISEDYNRPGVLRLGGNRGGDPVIATDFLFDIQLTQNGAPVSYTYFADESSICLDSKDGYVEIAFTDRAHLRIRGDGAGLRLVLRSAVGGGARACRGLYALSEGCGWEAEFGKYGKLFFRPLNGAFLPTYVYDDAAGAYSAVVFDFLPDAETGVFEAAIHEYMKEPFPFGEYEDFDDLVDETKDEFEEFTLKYPNPAAGYEEMYRYAMWTVWSRKSIVTEGLVEPMILFQVAYLPVAASWQQSYNAMAMLEDPIEAWRLICTMFEYQDPVTGRLPGMMSYAGGTLGMQPPFQGFALEFIISKIGDSFLTPEECERMYPKFAKWANYWTTYRNAGRGDDVIEIHSPNESGWDDAANFKDGFPANDPNPITFVILMMDSCARLARGCGKPDEAKAWQKRAEKLTKILIDEFWDGEKFVTKVKGKSVDSFGIESYQPIILGKRLPQEIIDKVAEKLTAEGEILTEIGLASDSMKSELVTFGISFVGGRVVGPQNMILTVGLQSAGKQKEADMIARRFCDHVKREGIILGYAPYDYYPLTGEKAEEQIPPAITDGWPWSSWTANCFLTMCGSVIGK